jgi:phage tail sheath protein FI
VAASVAAVSALSFNDRVAFPWFAPAGFNRASLDFVELTKTRINQTEREGLYAAHINPIVKYPRQGYVIMAQNTLEQAESALGSVNVQRMLISLKRTIINIGNRLLWEQITPDLYVQLRNQINPVLTTTQIRQGIESFKVICDNTNNTDADVNDNRINCKIILVPTKAVEFIAIDFIITRSGVSFA